MIINLKIPDSLYESYLLKFGSPGHYSAMKQAVEAFLNVEKGDRWILLSGDTRRKLEEIFGTTISSPDDLIRMTKNLNTVKIEGVEMRFDPEDLERIRTQAEFHGQSVEDFIRQMVEELKGYMLERV